jgi:hypothetical protein
LINFQDGYAGSESITERLQIRQKNYGMTRRLAEQISNGFVTSTSTDISSADKNHRHKNNNKPLLVAGAGRNQ